MKILIAEDEEILRNVLKEEFIVDGFEVKAAMDGEEAMKILKSGFKPNVMVLDLIMPVKDGFSVLEDIAADKLNNFTFPIVVLSNLGQDDDIKKSLKLGASDYFIKSQHPISEVVEKVKKILEKNKA